MNNNLSHIEFYTPDIIPSSKQEIVETIVNTMKQQGSIEYSGCADDTVLQESLMNHIGDGDISEYKNLTEENKKKIENIIKETIDVCNTHVTVPLKNYVFVYPYLPTKEDDVFGGVMAVAMYSCVFHLFISPQNWTKESLENTVAHELNHTIYYYNHFDRFNNYNVLDNLLLEGLAENFREQYFDKKITPWANALSREDALKTVDSLKDKLNSTDQKLINEILFGNEKYKKWTGYSVGYWIVKKFIEENPTMSWDDLMKQDIYSFIK